MGSPITFYRRLAAAAEALDWLLPTAARFAFAAVLSGYFLSSAMTKLDGLFSPSIGAYAQIFPRAIESVGYDASQLPGWTLPVVLGGAWAEFVLPMLIVIGIFTRPAALGMAGFVAVQSLTDILGHHAGPETVGAWFDRASDGLTLDQRAFWMLLFLVLVVKGAGPLSADWALRRASDSLAA